MRLKEILLAIPLVLILFGCKSKLPDAENLNIHETTKWNVDDFLTLSKVINIKNDKTIYSITKIIEINEDSLLVLDPINCSIFLINSQGEILNKYFSKGVGQNQFEYLRDFIRDKQGNLFLLDLKGHSVSLYNSKFQFAKKFKLSFEDRIPNQLAIFNADFIISAPRNLTPNSTKEDFSFLNFNEVSYLSVYNSNFALQGSFLNPSMELWKTNGAFALAYENFSPFVVFGNYIIATLQEGLFRIYSIDQKYNVNHIYNINDSLFKKIDLTLANDIKFKDHQPSFDQEKIGHIVGDHSIPVDLKMLGNILIVTIAEPTDNCFPQYSYVGSKRHFHWDLFRVSEGKVVPLGIKKNINSRILGIGNNCTIYLSDQAVAEKNNGLIIKKYQLRYENNKPGN